MKNLIDINIYHPVEVNVIINNFYEVTHHDSHIPYSVTTIPFLG